MTTTKKPAKKAAVRKPATRPAEKIAQKVATKRALWIEAMLTNGGNATQAALTAGAKTLRAAEKAGERMSKNVEVAAELARRRAEVVGRAKEITGLTVERTLREVARIAYFDPRKLFDEQGNLRPVHTLDDDTAAAIAGLYVAEEFAGHAEARVLVGFTKKLKLADKNAALDKAMKHLGQYEKDNGQVGKALAKAIYVPGKNP